MVVVVVVVVVGGSDVPSVLNCLFLIIIVKVKPNFLATHHVWQRRITRGVLIF